MCAVISCSHFLVLFFASLAFYKSRPATWLIMALFPTLSDGGFSPETSCLHVSMTQFTLTEKASERRAGENREERGSSRNKLSCVLRGAQDESGRSRSPPSSRSLLRAGILFPAPYSLNFLFKSLLKLIEFKFFR